MKVEDLFIEKVLTISTSHVLESVMNALELDSCNDNGGYGLFVMKKYEFGYTIYIGDDLDFWKSYVPSELYNCMQVAKNNGCVWLCLDGDGIEYPGLETFTW